MKKESIKYFLLIMLGLVVTSCGKKYLEVEPKGTQLEDNFYKNADEAYEGLVAIYDQIGGTSNAYINKFTATLAASDDHFAWSRWTGIDS